MSKRVLSPVNKELNHFHKLVNSEELPSKTIFIDIDDVKTKIREFKINEKGFLSLVIKYLTRCENSNWLNVLVSENLENLRINDCLTLTNYCRKRKINDELKILKSNLFFTLHYKNYHFSSKSIEYLIDNNLNDIINNLDGYYTYLDSKYISRKNDLKEISDENYSLLKNYSKSNNTNMLVNYYINKIFKKLKGDNDKRLIDSFFSRNIDSTKKYICIDGGNILHCVGGKISNESYKILDDLITKLNENGYSTILIIHKRHLDTNHIKDSDKSRIMYINKFISKKGNIFVTPYNKNDDYYILLLSLIGGFKIITRDNYGDHIDYLKNENKDYYYQIDYLLKDNLVTYELLGKLLSKYNFSFSENINKDYSNCIQKIENELFIPTDQGKFIRISL